MRNSARLILAAVSISVLSPAAQPAQGEEGPLQFIDVHSHLLPNMTVDEEIAMFKRAGIKAWALMSLPPDRQDLVKRYSGYIVPFTSFARSQPSKLLPLNDESLVTYGRMLDAGEMCGFGETGTMMDPREAPAASLLNPMYMKVYALAAAHGVPVNYHVDLDSPEVIAAVGRVADTYPRMPLILSHSGFNAGPDILAPLLAAHPNIFADVSIRMDPLNGFGDQPAGAQNRPNPRTMLDASGALRPEWRNLLERYPDRFMFAMDMAPTGPKGREQRAVELADIARKAFSVLPRASQEAIAHGNFEKLVRGCAAGPR